MKNTEAFWNKMAQKPSGNLSKSSTIIVQKTIDYLSQTDHIIDYGCGTGSLTNAMAKQVKSIKAIDTSSSMLDFAIQHAREKDVHNVTHWLGDLENIPVEQESIDVITSFSVLHYVQSLSDLAQQSHQILRKDGYFISATVCFGKKKSFFRFLLAILAKINVVPTLYFRSHKELVKPFTENGFSVVTIEKISNLPEYFIVVQKR